MAASSAARARAISPELRPMAVRFPGAQFLEERYRCVAAAVASGEPVAAEVAAFAESWSLCSDVAEAWPVDEAHLERELRSGAPNSLPALRLLPPEHATEEQMCLAMLKALRAIYLAPPGLVPAHSREPLCRIAAFSQACLAGAFGPLPTQDSSSEGAALPLTDAQKAGLQSACQLMLQPQPRLWPDRSLWLWLLAALLDWPSATPGTLESEEMQLGKLLSLLRQLQDPQRAASYQRQLDALAAAAAAGAASLRPLLTLQQLEFLCRDFANQVAAHAARMAA